MTFHFDAEINEDRKLVLTLPPEVPVGVVLEITITVKPKEAKAYGSLAEWSRDNPGHHGDGIRSDDVEGFTGRRF